MKSLRNLCISVAAILLLSSCSQANIKPHTALGEGITTVELRHYVSLRDQPISRVDTHLTEEEIKSVEKLLGKSISEKSIHYFHLRKKRTVYGLHGIFFTVTNTNVKALISVQRNRIHEIKVIKDSQIYTGEEYSALNLLLHKSFDGMKNIPNQSDYQQATPELQSLIDDVIVAMAILEVVHKES